MRAGKHVSLADLRQENQDGAAKTLSDAGFELTMDVSKWASVEALVQKAASLRYSPDSYARLDLPKVFKFLHKVLKDGCGLESLVGFDWEAGGAGTE